MVLVFSLTLPAIKKNFKGIIPNRKYSKVSEILNFTALNNLSILRTFETYLRNFIASSPIISELMYTLDV